MKYALILSTRGIEEVVDISNDLKEISKWEDLLRKECRRVDPDGAEIDCFIRSDEEARKIEQWREEREKTFDL